MKKLMLTVAAGVMGLTLSNVAMAQSPATPATTPSEQVAPAQAAPAATPQQGDEKVQIKTDEIATPVKATLATDAYKGWTIESAYHNKTKDIYEVQVKKDAEKKTLKFSKDGKSIS